MKERITFVEAGTWTQIDSPFLGMLSAMILEYKHSRILKSCEVLNGQNKTRLICFNVNVKSPVLTRLRASTRFKTEH